MRYHWTNVGPKPCSADVGNCPLDGGKAEHYKDKEEAQQAFEQKMRDAEGEFKSARKEVKLDEKVVKSVYGAYRKTLVSLKDRYHGRDTRTSALKQEALKVVADRYHVRIGDVKRTVRGMDEKIGLSHDHTESYEKELEYQEKAMELLDTYKDNPACPHCERVPEDADKLRVRVNPYVAELSDKKVPMYSCDDCHEQAWLDT